MNSFCLGVVALSGTWPRAVSGGLALWSLGHCLGFHHSASESVAHAMQTNLANRPDLFSAQWDCPHGGAGSSKGTDRASARPCFGAITGWTGPTSELALIAARPIANSESPA